MRLIFKSLIILIATYSVQIFIPWWSILLVPFLVNSLIFSKGFSSFGSGFIGVGLLWLIKATLIDLNTESILTSQIAELFSLPNTYLLILLTALIGGLAAGFAGLAGSHFRSLFKRKRKDLYYP